MALPAHSLPDPAGSEPAYLLSLTLRACEVARMAAANAADAIGSNAPAMFAAVDECEKELDALDRELDQRVCAALDGTTEGERRQLLASMKCMTDLERIGDLISTFSSGARILGRKIEIADVQDLIRMASSLERMLTDACQAFCNRDLNRAIAVLRADAELDRLRNLIFIRHVENPQGEPRVESIQVMLMAQSLERAGDHAKNLAEEVCHFVSGRSMRHVLRSSDRSYEQMFLDWLREQGSPRT
jgi:phosphate transport system protein